MRPCVTHDFIFIGIYIAVAIILPELDLFGVESYHAEAASRILRKSIRGFILSPAILAFDFPNGIVPSKVLKRAGKERDCQSPYHENQEKFRKRKAGTAILHVPLL